MIMGREKLFEEFLNECKKNNQICGAGNPYAHILLVGQEHRAKERINSVEAWKEYLRNNYRYCEKARATNIRCKLSSTVHSEIHFIPNNLAGSCSCKWLPSGNTY